MPRTRTRAVRVAAACAAAAAAALTLTACSQPTQVEAADPDGIAACHALIGHGDDANTALDDLTLALRTFNNAAGFANRFGDTDQVDHNLAAVDVARSEAESVLVNTTSPAREQARDTCTAWLDSLTQD